MSKLFGKYIIQKSDGTPFDPNAQYFVLRIDTDPAARKAALHYSSLVTENEPEFSEEIIQWVMQYEKSEGGLIEELQARIRKLEAELKTTDGRLEERNQVMQEIPECESHGHQCVPHAIEWVKEAKKTMRRVLD